MSVGGMLMYRYLFLCINILCGGDGGGDGGGGPSHIHIWLFYYGSLKSLSFSGVGEVAYLNNKDL